MDESRYTTLFGQEQSRSQVFAGLYLLLGGVVVGLGAIGLFLYAGAQEGLRIYMWREAALALGAVAITTFFLGISVALPSNRFMRWASYAGVLLCGVAIILFMIHYPHNFNVQDSLDPNQADHTALDTVLFALGLAVIVAGAFVSVVGYYVQRLGQWADEREVYEDEYGNKTYEVPDWVVEKDLEEAMRRHGVSWGMGDDAATSLKINLRDDELDGAFVNAKGRVNVIELDAVDNDTAVGALVGMRPENRNRKTMEATEVDDPVAALKAFRKQVQENPKEFRVKQGVFRKSRHGGPKLGGEP